jgi:hypothetical protein
MVPRAFYLKQEIVQMAHFRGTLQGRGGLASRLGTAKSGLSVKAASWQGAVGVALYVCNGVDYARVSLEPHHGSGTYRVIYDGPVSGGPVVAAGKEIDKETANILDT